LSSVVGIPTSIAIPSPLAGEVARQGRRGGKTQPQFSPVEEEVAREGPEGNDSLRTCRAR
jgi:hypothetical protein